MKPVRRQNLFRARSPEIPRARKTMAASSVRGRLLHLGRAMTRTNREVGVTVVEFAVIAPLFLLLVFGTIDFSMTMFNLNSAHFGTKAQTRLTSSANWGDDASCDLHVDQSSIAGNAASPAAGLRALSEVMCATKSKMKIANNRTRVMVRFENPDDPTAMVKGHVGRSVVICTMTSTQSATGMFRRLFDNRYIMASARSRIEEDISGLLSTGSETPFTGKDWGFCQPTAVLPSGWTSAASADRYCKVVWAVEGPPITLQTGNYGYNLTGTVSNLTEDPWPNYNVTFQLPTGHAPVLGSVYTEGSQSYGTITPDPLSPTSFTFAKPGGSVGVPLGFTLPSLGVGFAVQTQQSVIPAGMTPFSVLDTKIDGAACESSGPFP